MSFAVMCPSASASTPNVVLPLLTMLHSGHRSLSVLTPHDKQNGRQCMFHRGRKIIFTSLRAPCLGCS